jgi:hypothetical protein
MLSRNLWSLAVALTAVALGADPVSAQCPTTCQVRKLWFTEVARNDAVTQFVDGWGPSVFPPTSVAAGSMLYTLAPTAQEVADVVRALEGGCPVEVRFWTRGQLLHAGDAESGYSAHLETRATSPLGEALLGETDVFVTGPPTPTGNYPVEHVVPVLTAPGEGDSLTVAATAGAHANAVGSTTADYGSAYLKMYRERTSGAPILQMCVP